MSAARVRLVALSLRTVDGRLVGGNGDRTFDEPVPAPPGRPVAVDGRAGCKKERTR